jgi:hypothetical protein
MSLACHLPLLVSCYVYSSDPEYEKYILLQYAAFPRPKWHCNPEAYYSLEKWSNEVFQYKKIYLRCVTVS